LRRSGSSINIPTSVPQPRLPLSEILDRLEEFYGPQEPSFPVDPYEFLVWWYCGYPASDSACSKGWNPLICDVGIDPQKLLKAKPAKLALAIKPGGMFLIYGHSASRNLPFAWE
jgi:endonuclease III